MKLQTYCYVTTRWSYGVTVPVSPGVEEPCRFTSYCVVSLREAWIVHMHEAYDWDSCVPQGIMCIVSNHIRDVNDSSCVNYSTTCTRRNF